MLEGAVARLLNQLLGKYVLDLDTENLNVGIFSGQVQLTDLKLKPEALYELNLPVEVVAGTIGRISLQIPWSSLWNQVINVTIEDVHIVVNPIVTNNVFDAEKNKRLTRAAKKKILNDLDVDAGTIFGGPTAFAEHLITNILNHLQLNIINVHIRYEDNVSHKEPIAAGLCIGTITSESTNSKWKPAKYDNNSTTSHYLVKMEAMSVYWNWSAKLKEWNLPSQYYQWRNTMAASLQNYAINEQDFEFLLNPMTAKIKMNLSKSDNKNYISKLLTDIVVQDCNFQLTKNQYESIICVVDSLNRMLISWQFLAIRPKDKVLDNGKAWWKYACEALLEQRIRPYTWCRIRQMRNHYKDYLETYKQIILNPNDTELKMDLQKFEDNLSIVSIVIARQQARLTLKSRSINEKNLWSMLPSPERIVLCEKIGYFEEDQNTTLSIEHTYNFRLGNLCATLVSNSKEIMILTLTQLSFHLKPNFLNQTYKYEMKIEGLIMEGYSSEDLLGPILSSEHLRDSPAYFFKMELEKMPKNSKSVYRLNVVMDSVECIYNSQYLEEIENFFNCELYTVQYLLGYSNQVPKKLYQYIKGKLLSSWELNLNIRVPYIVIPDSNSYCGAENLLIIDLGKYSITTELCKQNEIPDNATQMELEEQMYTKMNIQCTDLQLLFCDSSDNWKDARREKDTEMHLVPKINFNTIYAICVTNLQTLPRWKCNITFPTVKINISERKVSLLLKFFNRHRINVEIFKHTIPDNYIQDKIQNIIKSNHLQQIQNLVTITGTFPKPIKTNRENEKIAKIIKERNGIKQNKNSDMNEAWANKVDLPGLEDNKSPNNNISVLLSFVIKEFSLIFSRSSDSTDRQYLMLRLGILTMDIALMTYGPAYQLSVNSVFLTDKLHTTPSGQYLDLIYSPIQSNLDVITVLYRKVSANCPDFWTHFHGVETSLVANFGTLHLLLHQESVHTIIKYSKYFSNKVKKQLSQFVCSTIKNLANSIKNLLHPQSNTPVPPGSVKFSHSARLSDLNVVVCDADFDIVNIQLSGLEMDFLFRANERFVFRSYLSNINVEHLSDVTLYSKVLSTDEDKVFDIKYVRNSSGLSGNLTGNNEPTADGSFKLYLGQMHCTFLYKLVVQLHRFIINLEALPFMEKVINLVEETVTQATDTLKTNSKINLSINVCGPVLLFPQKSSSPNVMVIDTGELLVENFFKDSPNDLIENVLVKLNGVTVTRGVMTLTSTLEMQETLIEPVNLNLDIKRYTSSKTSQKSWDIDSAMDSIRITLGQKDLSIILAICTDNIGEGKLLDLFPEQLKSPIGQSDGTEEAVKTLEAFFCEPKQKNIVAKCSIEDIQLLLFFDSGELLSSPIRDLNHGLCKLAIIEIDCSAVIYTDKSLDGKLSVDNVVIEEIGPDANVFDKIILQSPVDDNKNNNCHITVNKPPIVDVTFHSNQTGDHSTDIIIGRLCLSLSVPFCEKLALFIIECIPKENLLELGIINPGYEGEQHLTNSMKTHETQKQHSLTISLRINKPELIFLVETTSNRKRYFVTKSEILLDYSRHSNRLNLVTSFSGLHTLFYDLGVYSTDPYVIVKQCDIEYCQGFSEDKGEKVTLSISSIYIRFCSEVVHSINDILNDIIEHFKVPDIEPPKLDRKKSIIDTADLWEPKKMNDYIELKPDYETLDSQLRTKNLKGHEVFLVPKFDIVIIMELEQIPILLLKSTVELTLYDWSSLLSCTCELSIQANYFNESNQQWEPVIDPVVVDECEYRPWDILIKIFQDRALCMWGTNASDNNVRNENVKNKMNGQSYPTTEEEDSGEDMMYLEPINVATSGRNRRVKTSLSTFLDDSDSENDDGAMEKLAAAISDLFTGDWNENDDSDCAHSSDADDETDEAEKTKPQKQDSIDNVSFKKGLYILIDAKETLNLTLTPKFLKVFNELLTMYSNKILSVNSNRNVINLVNDIGPKSKVELYEKQLDNAGNLENNILLHVKTYENQDSVPNSPTKNSCFASDLNDSLTDSKENITDDFAKQNFETAYDFNTLSSLSFPLETTSSLYDRINKNFLKIHIPNFHTVQTNCSNRNWEKLIRLQSSIHTQTYYLAAKHTLGKNGRNVVISSPLQIRNETCFALSILYQPAMLKQFNLESVVGEVTNPFETTLRITVLEPHEHYNVPLYIAYHSKIYVQPAYAESHYASDSDIWWQDLATELDTPTNLLCRPKSESTLEVFSLKVIMHRNVPMKNSHSHTLPNYVISLLPPLILYNFLPYTLQVQNVTVKQMIKVEPGEKNSIYSLDLTKDQKLVIKLRYNGAMWCGNLNLTPHLDEKILMLTSEDGKESLAVNVKTDRDKSCEVFFYTPYWIVNKTTLPLQIKVSATNTVYQSPNEDILLFTYKRHGKQTLNVRVYESNWSNEFGLECAGTTGLVVCKDPQRKKKYLFFLQTKLANLCPRLTKIVTLLPSFLVTNNTDKFLRFMEHNERTDLWIDLPPFKTLIFWPETSSMEMYVKYRDSKLISQAFFVASNHRTVLRLDKGSALTVEVTGGVTDSFHVNFHDYQTGDAPVLVKNYCADIFLKIQQQDQSPVTLLSPSYSLLYTWDDPTRPRQLVWNVYNNKGNGFHIDVSKDGYGEERIKFHSVTPNTSIQHDASSSDDTDSSDSVIPTHSPLPKKVRKDKIIIYWLCYRQDSLQRILLFTQELRIYNNILRLRFQERCHLECLVSLAGCGISIFTDTNDPKKEHLYCSLVDAPAIWEVNVGHKWKTLTLELASWIEDKYRQHSKKTQLKDYIHIDFEKMFMLKPFFAELRRTYHPAVYLHYRKSKNWQYCNIRIQSAQIDDQIKNSIVLYQTPSTAVKELIPFVDFAITKQSLGNAVEVYRNIKLAIADLYLNIENELIIKLAEMMKLFNGNKYWSEETSQAYVNDVMYIHKPIQRLKTDTIDCKTIIENVNLSSFAVQLNVANKMQMNVNHSGKQPFGKFLDYLFPLNISPYMPMEGVHHKITSIEMVDKFDFLNNCLHELYDQILSQFLQQYYSHVLGLQVLVNSFAIQPAIEPYSNDMDKMANILLYGSRCLLGHVNMSPAALEQCIIDIFANQNIENIQRIRRHGSYHKTEVVSRTITASSRNFNTGVPNALQQLIVKNQTTGVHSDGEMFFRTTGKALLSLLTRHPEEKSNSVKVAEEALRRAYILGEPIKIHQRLTRYTNKYLGLKPFSVYESMGQHLLETIANSRFTNDTYWAHGSLDKSGKSIILVSLEHLIRINKCRLWGNWEVEWGIDLDDIISMPKITTLELILNMRQGEENLGEQIKIVGDKEMLLWLHEKIEQAIIVSMEDKSWSLTNENQ